MPDDQAVIVANVTRMQAGDGHDKKHGKKTETASFKENGVLNDFDAFSR
jgi:hypothetical protein